MRRHGLGGPSGRLVYHGGRLRAFLIGLFLSWGAMNFIALVLEHRTGMLLDPWNQYKAFYWGDSICLPGIVLMIWCMGWYMPMGKNLTHKNWWHAACFAGGLAYGVAFHFWEASTHFYTYGQDNSPTKLYHDFVVFPLYIYITFSAGWPAFFRSRVGWKPRLVALGLLAAYICLNVWDNFPKPTGQHVNYSWSGHMHFLLQFFS